MRKNHRSSNHHSTNFLISSVSNHTLFFVFSFLFIILFLFSFCLFPSGEALASPNYQMNYQGKLTDATNIAVPDGSYNIQFRLCTTSDCVGTVIWTEVHCYSPDNGTTCNGTGVDQRVTVTSGLFSSMIGSVLTNLSSINFNQTLYLGVTIGGSGTTPSWDPEMSPRKTLGTVPSAFESKNSDTLDSRHETEFALLAGRSGGQSIIGGSGTTDDLILQSTSGIGASGSDIILKVGNNGATEAMRILYDGKVGIGTVTPRQSLDILKTDIQLRLTYTDNSVFTDFITNSSGYLTISPTGARTGIGSLTPRVTFDILNPSTQLRLTYTDNSVYTDFLTNSSGYLGISPSGGRVGIGTTSPDAARLHVYSNTAGANALYVTQTSATGYGIGVVPGADATYPSLYLQNAANSATRHAFFGSGDAYFANGGGNVGIGMTNPTYKLHVTGNEAISGIAGAPNLVVTGPGNTTIANNLAFFQGTSTAGNLVAVTIEKPSTASLFFGINKSTITGSVPANSPFVSTYATDQGLSIGRGGSNDLPSTSDIYINTSGNVGISTTTVNSMLHVRGTASANDSVQEWGVGGGSGNYSTLELFKIADTSSDWLFRAYRAGGSQLGKIGFGGWNATPWSGVQMALDTSTGFFGIGTTSPGSKLGVSGNAAIGSTYATIAAPANGAIIESDVGIGTGAPSARLNVVSSITSTSSWGVGVINNSYNNYDANPTVAYPVLTVARSGKPGTTWTSKLQIGISRWEDVGTAARSQANFNLGHGSTEDAEVTVMSLRSNGNVGIGDSSPDTLLDLLATDAANTQITITNTNAGSYNPQIGLQLVEGTNNFTLGVDDSDSDKFKISTTALGTSDRFVIDGSGNITLGGTTIVSGLLNADGGIAVDTDNFTVSGTTGSTSILSSATTGNLLSVSLDAAAVTGAVNGLNIDLSPISGGDFAKTGIAITGDDDGTAVSTGLSLAGTVDYGIDMNGATMNTAELRLKNANTIANGAAGTITINVTTLQLAAASTIQPSASGTIALQSNGANAVTVDTGGASTLNLGSTNATTVNLAAGAAATALNVATGVGGNTILIGTNNTLADTITIGSALDALSLAGDDWSVTDAGIITTTGLANLNGGIAVDTDNFTVSGTTGALGIVNAMTTGTTMAISYDAATQTGALTGSLIDLTNITNDNTNNIYGLDIKQFTLGAGITGNLYGAYIEGTNWDYGLYVADASYLGATTLAGNLIPSDNDLYTLGDDTHRWADIYLGAETIHLGTSITDELKISYTTSSNTTTFQPTTDSVTAFQFQDADGGVPVLNIDSDNERVGIGTASPVGKLQVDRATATYDNTTIAAMFGDPSVSSGSVNTYIIGNTIQPAYGYDGDDGNLGINYRGYNGGVTRFRDFTIYNGKGTSVLFVDGSAGNVGIGVSDPTNRLEIRDTGVNSQLKLSTGAGTTNGGWLTNFGDGGLTMHSGVEVVSSNWIARSANAIIQNLTGGQAYWYANSGLTPGSGFAPTVRMTLTVGGNLGIGTSIPTSPLSVTAGAIDSYKRVANFFDTSATAIPYITVGKQEVEAADTSAVFGYDAANNVTFLGVNGDPVGTPLHIKRGGNVGIGVTNPTAKFQIIAQGLSSAATVGSIVALQHQTQTADTRTMFMLAPNGTNNNADLLIHRKSDVATNFEYGGLGWDATPTFILSTNAGGSGTRRPIAIDASGGSSQLYLDTSNKVGIGDSSPDTLLDILSTADNTQITITNTSGSDYDPKIGLQLVEGTNNFTLGVDDSVTGDPFVIGTTALGTGNMFVLDSRSTTSAVSTATISAIAPTIASAADAEYTTLTVTPPTITLTGTTQVTSQMDSILFNQPTITDAEAVTVDSASTLTVAGAPVKAGSVTLTNTYGLKVNSSAVSTATNSYGIYIDAQTGATNNYGMVINTGNVGIGDSSPDDFKLQIAGSVGPDSNDDHDLGSNALRWQDIYLGPATIHLGTSTSDESKISYDTASNTTTFQPTTDSVTAFQFQDADGGTPILNVDSDNERIGIGNSAPTNLLDVGSTSTGGNVGIYATLGSELAPALTEGNWTIGAGWENPIVGPGLIKNADGTGTQTPSAATTIVAGTTYKVVITLSALSVGSATYTLGGVTGSTLSAVTTYTDYITASTTGKLIITPTNTSRFTISSISYKALSDSTGDLTVYGNLEVRSNALFTGNLGIGTANPSARLDVSGDIMLSGSNRYINFNATNGTSGYGFRDNAGTMEFKNSSGSWAGIGSSSGLPWTSQEFTSSGTWTKPAVVSHVWVLCVGGGGGGKSNFGGGGGAGEVRASYVTVSSDVTVTIGTGGATDSDGGATTFGALLSAAGGKGATGDSGGAGGGSGGIGGGAGGNNTGGKGENAVSVSSASNPYNVVTGGAGGGGDSNYTGGAGGNSGLYSGGAGGAGGSNGCGGGGGGYGGAGGYGGNFGTSPGQNGQGYGAGGGGNGGTGYAGYCKVWWQQ